MKKNYKKRNLIYSQTEFKEVEKNGIRLFKADLLKILSGKGFLQQKNGIMIPSWKKMEFGIFQSGICKNLKWKITAPMTVQGHSETMKNNLHRISLEL